MSLLLILLLAASAGGLAVRGGAGTSLQCLDEDNNPVVWYILYKLPTAVSVGSPASYTAGDDYMYLLPGQTQWTFSKRSIADPGSLLGTTLNNFFMFFKPKTTVEYQMYNNEVPYKEERDKGGHTKGVAAYDATTNKGFWIIHSVPGFPKSSFDGAFEMFRYPGSGFVNGQIALCISLSGLSVWNDVKSHIKFIEANVFSERSNTPTKFNYSESLQMAGTYQVRDIQVSGVSLKLIAKDHLFADDLYKCLVATECLTSFYVQTWLTSGKMISPVCTNNYEVYDIADISIEVPIENNDYSFAFSETKDHGKWAVSTNENDALPWVCIGDINRTESQKKRGGGTVCLKDKNVWTVFNKMVSTYYEC